MPSHQPSPDQAPDTAASDHALARGGAAAVAVAGLISGGAVLTNEAFNDDQPVPRVAPLTQTLPNFVPTTLSPDAPVVLPQQGQQPTATTDKKPNQTSVSTSHKSARLTMERSSKTTANIPEGWGERVVFTPEPFLDPTESKEPPQDILPDPETVQTPEAMNEFFAENVVYLEGIGCSGTLVRNAQTNEPIGIQTAEHCKFRGIDGRRSRDAQGNPIIIFEQPIRVMRGDSKDALQEVGQVKQLFLSAPDDTKYDMAFGVFGDTPEDLDAVLANSRMMPEEAIKNLRPGDTIYSSGWPVDQPGNTVIQRQAFAMTILGTNLSRTKDANGNQETVQTITAALPAEYAAICSFGASGATAEYGLPNGEVQSVGVLATFNDWGRLWNKDPEIAAETRAHYEQLFGVTLDGYSAICSFAYEAPKKAEGAELARVVAPSGEQPGNPHEALINWYKGEFFKADFKERQWAKGLVQVEGGKESLVIDSPAVHYDAKTGVMLLGWHEPGSTEPLRVAAFDGNKAGTWPAIKIFDHGDDSYPGMVDSEGEVTVSEAGFNDGQRTFGLYRNQALPPEDSPTAQFKMVNNHVVVEALGGTAKEDMQAARQQFFDANHEKVALQGYVTVGSRDNYEDVLNPAISYNQENGGAVLLYNRDGNPVTKYYRSLEDIYVFNQIEASETPLFTFNRPTARLGEAGLHKGFYTTEFGKTIGKIDLLRSAQSGTSHQVVFENGQLKMKRATSSGGGKG